MITPLAACQCSFQQSLTNRLQETSTSKNIYIQRQCYHQSTSQLSSDKKSSAISQLNTQDNHNANTSNAVDTNSLESTSCKLKQSPNKTINIKDRIKITSLQDGIVHVVLSRPSKLNSLDLPMFNAIAEAASLLKNDTTLNKNMRVVIISGEGRAFCTGLIQECCLIWTKECIE